MLHTIKINVLSDDTIKEYFFYHTPIECTNFHQAQVGVSIIHSYKELLNLREHVSMSTNDKAIWYRAYLHGYIGFTEDTHTWEYITDAQYQAIPSIDSNTLPAMALSTINHNAYDHPIWAKYRIVALGNLDPNTLTNNDCFTPVMSQLET